MESGRVICFLGIDGGGTKTEFVLIDATGRVLALRRAGSAYHLEVGMQSLRRMLAEMVNDMLNELALAPDELTFAFVGLPAYGESSALLPALDNIFDGLLPKARYHCANDVVCGWAGALGGQDGVAVVAGTGSIAYGEYGSRQARAGGWGELFSDEGSAFWLAREALALFSRMSDGRVARGPLYPLVRAYLGVVDDLDVCEKVYGPPALSRSELAALSLLVTEAARAEDRAALDIFDAAARELAALMHAVRDRLGVPADVTLAASYCGGLLQADGLLLPRFEAALNTTGRRYALRAPRLRPATGAAVTAARLAGAPLDPAAIARLHASYDEAVNR